MSLANISIIAAFTKLDYAVLAVYLIAVVALGIWMGRGQSSLTGYFLANRKAPWIVACFSIIATDFSAISYMGMPAWVYQKDLKYIFGQILTPLTFLLVVLVFVPIYFRLQVFTVYEYLEKRFHPLVRTVTALLFLCYRGLWMASAIYIPSIALSTAAGLNIYACIIAIGLLTTLYTMLGGMRAVLWTDFIQLIIMIGGLFLIIGIQLHAFDWNLPDVWNRVGAINSASTGSPHTTWIDFGFDLKTESTFWSLLFFLMIYNLGSYGTDQVVVQRYFTMKSKRQIVWSVMTAGFLTVPVVFLLGIAGILFVAYYNVHPELAGELSSPDAVLPHFVVNVLPAGLRGLIFAALFAATMSSVSSGLNSFSTVGVMDLYRRYLGGSTLSERHNFFVAKIFTVVCGALATLVAIWISTFETTILQTLVGLASKFIGPIAGIFLLGALTRRTNTIGVLIGATFGLITAFTVDFEIVSKHVNWLWTAPLTSLVTFLTGYLASLPMGGSGAAATQSEAGLASE